eukprot:comp12344_c0_seq1/m.7202 comp12344_c0_seq1/g.7202  ORF comp12344_c0_seq1/g.7202 comp12344_c0_seq1/m.7202 type:complete len:221 (-) comp12344_c0_seq1:215-877(-)
MFTGIVKGLQPAVSIVDKPGLRHLTVCLGPVDGYLAKNVEGGASIAVNGCCLTVAGQMVVDGELHVVFDIMQETLTKTNLGAVCEGHLVNVERSLKFGDELGGHQLSGHVDTTAMVREIKRSENNRELVFAYPDPEHWNKYVVPKGYIAVDGASLTVVDVGKDYFSVCLIPETLARTTLGKKEEGGVVNIEFDNTTKTIVQTIERTLPHIMQEYMARRAS